MRRVLAACLLLLGACYDFDNDHQRCIAAGGCVDDAGSDAGVDAGLRTGPWALDSSWFPSLGGNQLFTIWGASPNQIWAGGRGGIVQWDGGAWSGAALTDAVVNGIWGTSATSVWAVGGFPDGGGFVAFSTGGNDWQFPSIP